MSDLGTKVALGQIKPLGGFNIFDLSASFSNPNADISIESLYGLTPEQRKDSYVNSVSEIASGYALGKMIDTNDNPSAVKTAGAVFAGGVVGDAIHSFALRKMLGTKTTPTFGVTMPNFIDLGASLMNGYHGYLRHDSFGFGLLWFLFGGNSGLGVALSQGFDQPLNRSNPHCVPNHL